MHQWMHLVQSFSSENLWDRTGHTGPALIRQMIWRSSSVARSWWAKALLWCHSWHTCRCETQVQWIKFVLIFNIKIIPSRGHQYVTREQIWSSLMRRPDDETRQPPPLTAAGGHAAHCCIALLSGFTPLYFANDTVALSTFGDRERTARADINNT